MKGLLLGLMVLGSVLSPQSTFDAAVVQFERAWGAGEADAVSAMLHPDGIRLQLGGVSHALVAGRQARGALSEFLGARATGRLEAQRTAEPRGEPARGSAQFRWQTVVQGTSERVVYTVFVEFTRVSAGWRVSELRVF